MRSWDSHGIGKNTGYGIDDGIAQKTYGIWARIARDSKTRHDGINHHPIRVVIPSPPCERSEQTFGTGHFVTEGEKGEAA